MYNVMANFKISRDFDNYEDAVKAFDEMVRDGCSYVELSRIIQYQNFDKYESIKIHW